MKQGVIKKGVLKSVLSIILTAILVLGLIPSVPVKLVVHAEGEQGEANTVQVTYVDENKTVQTVDAIPFTSDLCIPDPDFPNPQDAPIKYYLGNPNKTTYYYVGEDIEVSEGIELEGNIVLILGDGVTFNDVYDYGASFVGEFGPGSVPLYTVSIYGQNDNNGKMIMNNPNFICFGCNCEIYGGVISFVHLSGWNILLNDGEYYYLDGNDKKIVIEGIKDMTETDIKAFFNEKTIYPIYPSPYINIQETQNGTVSVKYNMVLPGTKVNPTITPDEGYVLDSYTVIDADGEPVEVAEDYSFTMPEKNVTIAASFAEPAEKPVISDQTTELIKEYGYASDAFTIDVEEVEGHEYSYQWYTNTTNSNEGGSPIEGETNASLTIAEGKDAGIEEYYYCEITATRTGTSQTAQTVSDVCKLTVSEKIVETPEITLDQDEFVYDGLAKKPTVTVKYGDTSIPSSEYTVNYANNVEAGEATVTVKDIVGGNYTIGKEADNYSITIPFKIKKKVNPTITLSEDTFTYDGTEHKPEVTLSVGSEVWAEDDYTVSYSKNKNAGEAIVSVKADDKLYYFFGNEENGFTTETSFTINKADKPDNTPSASQKVAYKNAKIGDVELPAGWQWKSNDKQLTLTIGKFTNATAEYVAEDKDNYKTTTVSIDVSRLACNHTNTELRNAKEPTTTEKGYTGDTYCKDCGKIVSYGQVKNKLPGGSGGSSDKADDKKPKYSNEWVNGKWYNEAGVCDYEGTLEWKSDSTGWWVEDSAGWYPQSQWQKIDGNWYYFKSSGYMAAGEYYNGYWFNSDGTMDDRYYLTWKSDSTGWWVEDISGWWPSSQWLQIDGYWYYFDASGYMVTNQYVDGYWLGADGACQ